MVCQTVTLKNRGSGVSILVEDAQRACAGVRLEAAGQFSFVGALSNRALMWRRLGGVGSCMRLAYSIITAGIRFDLDSAFPCGTSAINPWHSDPTTPPPTSSLTLIYSHEHAR
jgi:hypothetical protein